MIYEATFSFAIKFYSHLHIPLAALVHIGWWWWEDKQIKAERQIKRRIAGSGM